MNEHELVSNINKLHWACRRGMLELDVLLGNFLNEAYPGLDLSEKQLFARLLSCTDPELLAWLMGNERPDDEELVRITDLIRSHARSRI